MLPASSPVALVQTVTRLDTPPPPAGGHPIPVVPTVVGNRPPPSVVTTAVSNDGAATRAGGRELIRQVSIDSNDSATWPLGAEDDAVFLKAPSANNAPSGNWPLSPARVFCLAPATPYGRLDSAALSHSASAPPSVPTRQN
ncbi:hypothetical protein QE373_003115 [Stenotrophomonas sp. SORGH_AS321]|nr:hypothetical protein [Stenotrophomonas sp. SORGH_AS_0321]